MKPDKINLVANYARQTIRLHDVFVSSPLSTEVLRAYALNETSQFTRKFVLDTAKFGPASPNCVSGSDMDLTHTPSCDSVGECTLKQLMEMPDFKNTMIQGLSSAKIRVTEAVKRIDHLNVDHRPAMEYRAIA
ncbi:Hypothetical protein PHPALM_18137 [Phytophthora palmivora]|uniref:Uncharacterized protein n=1 Tax=Phytophthora palmivora TaxID=4796 RepID=A0A2P4XKH4_9STRA|nr:Hypothetical protein PHPALM_18137 [Phytophthora palmivora]